MALLPEPAAKRDLITAQETAEVVSTGVWGDRAALSLVLSDTNRAEIFEASKAFVMFWYQAATLYQSPYMPRFWPGTQIEAASIPMFTVATHVNSLVPQIVKGLFYDEPPFVIQERPGTKAQAARAIGAILNYQLEDLNFKNEIELGCINTILFGTGIWKWGWESYTKTRTIYKLKRQPVTIKGVPGTKDIVLEPDDDDNIEPEDIEEVVSRPFFEHIVNLRYVLVDPGLNVPDIRKAKYVIHRMYKTYEELEQLRDRPGMNLPSKEELRNLLFPPREEPLQAVGELFIRNPLWDARAEARWMDTSEDPLSKPLEVLERWDGNRMIMVLQQKAVICSDKNPYGTIPFLSCGWWDVPDAFWSMGLAKLIGSEQRVQQGVLNTWLDNLALNLNGVYTRVRGKSVPTQSIRLAPGKIIDVDSPEDFNPLKRLDPIPEAGQQIQMSQQRAEQVSGAGEAVTQGIAGASGHSNLARSAAGASILGAGVGARIEKFIDKIATQVFVPFLFQMQELNRALLPAKVWKQILSDELQHEYFQSGGQIVDLLNARVKFSILAGAKMAARRNMAQALPIIVQELESEAVIQSLAMEGKKVDYQEIVRMIFEVSDWKNYNDVIVPMTPDDMKRWQSMQPGAQAQAQAQGKQALQDRAFQQKQELVDQENVARGAREVLRQALEKSTTPLAISGEPGTEGFGSNA